MLRSGEAIKIRDLAAQGLSISEIARQVGHDRKTVRAAIERGFEPPPRRRRGGTVRDAKLEPFKEYLRARMAEGVFNCAVLLDELRTRGYTGGMTVLRRYVRPFRPRRALAQPVVRFETEPGEQAQADFVDIPLVLPNGATKLLRLFNYTLGYSRYAEMRFMPDESRLSWFRALDHAFRATGGVPRMLLTDRASPLVQGADENGHPVFAPEYLAFAAHYGFIPKVARKAQTKGKVERQGGYVQENFLPRIRGLLTAPVDLGRLNALLRDWLDTVCNLRVHGTTHARPIDRFAREQAFLGPLPFAGYGLEQVAVRRVSRDGYVQWKTCRYAVPVSLCGRDVYVHETPTYEIRVEFDGQYVAVYPRSQERHAVLDDGLRRIQGRDAAVRSPHVLVARQTPDVERWPLSMYEALAEVTRR